MPEWICKECGIESSDHGSKCGERISDRKIPDEVDKPERKALIALCYMLRDAARKARDSGLAKDDEEFDRLLGFLNQPRDKLFERILREIGGK